MNWFKSLYNLSKSVDSKIFFIVKQYKSTYPCLIFNKEHLTMNVAYFRYIDGADKFQVAFEYNNEELNVLRQFNMDRPVNETVYDFKNRIKSNIMKIIEKKVKNKKKKNKEADTDCPDVEVDIVIDGISLRNELLAKDALYDQENMSKDKLLRVDDNTYKIIINGPWIRSLKLPSCILAECLIYPTKFEYLFTSEIQSLFQWYKEVDNTFVPIGQGFFYKTSNEDVGHRLKLSCTPKNETQEGPTMEVVTETAVQASPGNCLYTPRHAFTQERLLGDSFRIVTYNILAEIYADTDAARTELFVYCPQYALEGEYRRQLIIQELLGYNSDIICLQEVDEKCYHRDLSPTLLHFQNLNGNFCLKSGNACEGLAIFYRSDRYRLIESSRYVLGEELKLDHPYNFDLIQKVKTNEKLYTRLSERNTTLQTVVLQPLNEVKLLFIANTHLYFHPDADHIRLIQSAFFMAHIQHCITELRQKKPDYQISLIFCGDFNSSPDCGMYRLMTENKVPPNVEDWRSNSDEIIEGVSLSQPYSMDSACGTPDTTNFTVGFTGCLDYIYYQKDQLQVTQVVPFPSKEDLELFSALPSPVCPSDHLALIADLKWTS